MMLTLSTRGRDRLRQQARLWHWKAIEQGRIGWYVRAQVLVRRELRREIQAIARAVGESSLQQVRLQSEDVIAQHRDQWNVLLRRLYQGVTTDFGKIALRQLGQGQRALAPREVKELGSVTRNWIRSEAARKVSLISETTLRLLQSALDEGFAAGESVNALQARILQLDELRSPARALRIARTEVINASNAGQVLMVEDESTIDETIVEKEWLTARDEAVRETHREADGQVVQNNEAFQIGGDELRWPGDTGLGADASNTINCRCTLLFAERRAT